VGFAWDFGDGSPIVAGGASSVNHVYNRYGSFTATLTVTDSNAPREDGIDEVA
jgi:PKD repeat protein